jgi:hypothetical protein
MTFARTAAVLALLAVGQSAQAVELYTGIGVPGVMLGVAQPLGPLFGVRVDYMTFGKRDERSTEEGITYDATLKTGRTALLADWFPFGGSFRFSGGVTTNQHKIDLLATGASGSLTIGNTTYTTTAQDRFRVFVKFPTTTPYIGLGWGHQGGTGLRFSADIGASIGKAKVSYELSGPNANAIAQADIDAELAQLRDGVGKVRVVPQLSVGLGYSF